MKLLIPAALAAALAATPALAQSGHNHGHATPAASSAAATAVNSGEVRRISTDTKKITIAHGPLKAFDMPSMTMAFAVKDPSMLAKVKQGDKVNFVLEKSGEDLVITRIEAVR